MRKETGGKQNALWQQVMFCPKGSSVQLRLLISEPSSSFFELLQVPFSCLQGEFSSNELSDDLHPCVQ